MTIKCKNLFPNGMKVRGCALSPDEIEEAVNNWRVDCGYHGLAHAIEGAQPLFDRIPEIAVLAADRILQKLRQAGHIEYDKAAAKWREKVDG